MSSKFWLLAGLAFATTVAAVPQYAVADEFETEVKFWHGERGELDIDASDGKSMFPIPKEPRYFEDADQFAKFAVEHLNAEVVLDKEGYVIGVTGDLTVTDTPVYVDEETKEIIEIEDPLAAFLGGKHGVFFVGDTEICVDPKACPEQNIPGDDDERDGFAASSYAPQAAYSISGSSSYVNIWFYKYGGATTKQRSGGWKKTTYFCWKHGFIPWVCSKTSGWNNLTVRATYVNRNKDKIRQTEKTRKNVSSVTTTHWGLYVMPTEIWCTHDPDLCKMRGVQGDHRGNGPEGSDSKTSCVNKGC